MTSDDPRRDDGAGGRSADETLRQLMALAAVDALDDDDRADFDLLIADRPDLQEEYADLRASATLMADAVASPPPPSLKANLLAAIANEEQLLPPARPAAVSPSAPSLDPSADEADARGSAPAPVRPAPVVPMRRRGRTPRWLGPVLAAAAAVGLVFGATAIVRHGDDDGSNDVATAVLEDPDHLVMPFTGDLATLSMIYSPDHGAAVLSGTGVAPPGGTNVYELWLLTGDEAPAAVDVFRPDSAGVVQVIMRDVELPDDVQFAITIEPDGGSDIPTTPIIGQTA